MDVLKSYAVDITKAADPRYDASFVMSASAPDRVKDTIEPAAYDKAVSYSKKLIALWQHDSNNPIGYWENLRHASGQLVGDIKFASTQMAKMAKTLLKDGVPLGASIGFRGKGEPNKAGGIHFKVIELMECSIVSVPCHPQAMQIAKQFGYDPAGFTKVAMSFSQHAALNRAKGLLSVAQEGAAETPISAFDSIVAEARTYLVANASDITPDLEIEIKFSAGDFEVCFERS